MDEAQTKIAMAKIRDLAVSALGDDGMRVMDGLMEDHEATIQGLVTIQSMIDKSLIKIVEISQPQAKAEEAMKTLTDMQRVVGVLRKLSEKRNG